MTLDTKLIHAGQEPDPVTGAVNVPINVSSTYKQDGIGRFRSGYEYSRTGNPSRLSLEATLAAIENGTYARAFASGLAAENTLLSLLHSGDEVVGTSDIYGGTYRLFTKVFPRFGVTFRPVEGHDPADFAKVIGPKTKLIWVETPTNPLLNLVDIAAVAALKPRNAWLAVDNTFASPYFQTPLDFGADIVVHSATKYLGGHSDVIGGALVYNDPALDEELKYLQNAQGGILSPFDSYLIQRGIKTLGVRMKRHEATAWKVAEFLRGHPRVSKVLFAGFDDHPGAAVARKQMRGQPGIVSFVHKGSKDDVDRFFQRLKLFTFAESLGGVESLTCYPYEMTHGSIPPAVKDKIGISDRLVRLSVGLEDEDELVEDLKTALA
jgi:cystathionine beta-lyase/cystathionine gamma-synthase